MRAVNDIVLLLCAGLLIPACDSRRRPVPPEIVTSENTEADFGIIKESKGKVSTTLLCENVTGDTLYPLQTYTRCTCVAANVDREPVPPGEYVKMKVTYNPAYRKGIFMEEIQIGLDGHRHNLSLIIKGEVIPMLHPVTEDQPYDYGSGLYMSHKVMPMGTLSPGAGKSFEIRYANDTRRKMSITFVPETEDFATALSFRKNLDLPRKGRDTVNFHFTMPEGLTPGDTITFPIRPRINGKATENALTFRAIVGASTE